MLQQYVGVGFWASQVQLCKSQKEQCRKERGFSLLLNFLFLLLSHTKAFMVSIGATGILHLRERGRGWGRGLGVFSKLAAQNGLV